MRILGVRHCLFGLYMLGCSVDTPACPSQVF
uniref:Uncharacterized protein n=1 Tax=Setaria viridis TaxID=4556 RepID=A0A4U6VHS5_SETVI|nr:hypothetical protein SEVIR_3G298150v2 [Setaria viridis]